MGAGSRQQQQQQRAAGSRQRAGSSRQSAGAGAYVRPLKREAAEVVFFFLFLPRSALKIQNTAVSLLKNLPAGPSPPPPPPPPGTGLHVESYRQRKVLSALVIRCVFCPPLSQAPSQNPSQTPPQTVPGLLCLLQLLPCLPL
jgi:hypothetical protein